MFSEYASRFLAQSQSRLSSFGQQQPPPHFDPDGSAPSSRAPPPDWISSRPSRLQARSFLSRGPYSGPASNNATATTPAPHSGNPYQPAGSRFGFASRISAAQDAPLFRSVASDFHHDEEDDHGDGDDDYDDDREAKDLFALQRSRRVAAASKLAESSDTDNDASRGSLERSAEAVSAGRASPPGPGPGSARSATGALRSNWPARRPFERARTGERDALLEGDEDEEEEDGSLLGHTRGGRGGGAGGGGGAKGKMVDVGLESQLGEDEMAGSLLLAGSLGDTSPPAFQQFKFQRPGTGRREEPAAAAQESGTAEHGGGLDFDPEAEHAGAGHELGQQQQMLPRPIPLIDGEWFKHDGFFACAFIILQFALFSTFVLVWLQTTTPTGPIGDTIYTALRASFHMLAVDTVVSIVVALFWLAALRSFVRPLVTAVVVATPAVLLTFSLYSFVWSFKGDTHGRSLQDTVMRWTAVVPAIGSVLWVYVVFRARRAIRRAVEILEFSSRILSANPALLMLGLLCLTLIVVWTWVWLVMFNRIFLEGHFSRSLARWVMSVSSWWLGAWFVFMHLWTVSVISSVQQAATAATVSQWYFHRNAGPAPPSSQIVSAAVAHALSKIFGTICESTLLSLLVRLPLIVLPGRVCAVITRVAALWLPTPVAALTNPLAITFAAIHSQSLAYSAKGISQIDFLSAQFPTTALTPRAFATPARSSAANSLLPYRLAKTILVATRYLMATALGFAGWVFMAKNLYVAMPDGMGWRGSAYAYVVGIVASLIGLYIMGTMEGVLGGIVDAVVVCYGSERRMLRGAGGSAGAYCMEAAYLFGDRRRPGDDEEDGL